eukprot:snap_masked-scaffold_2-processed-gene-4.6-mRNA-1 protein AED:1.00 eAED:1.00 QI:0/-1/0/0/-1/1/1/0/778
MNSMESTKDTILSLQAQIKSLEFKKSLIDEKLKNISSSSGSKSKDVTLLFNSLKQMNLELKSSVSSNSDSPLGKLKAKIEETKGLAEEVSAKVNQINTKRKNALAVLETVTKLRAESDYLGNCKRAFEEKKFLESSQLFSKFVKSKFKPINKTLTDTNIPEELILDKNNEPLIECFLNLFQLVFPKERSLIEKVSVYDIESNVFSNKEDVDNMLEKCAILFNLGFENVSTRAASNFFSKQFKKNTEVRLRLNELEKIFLSSSNELDLESRNSKEPPNCAAMLAVVFNSFSKDLRRASVKFSAKFPKQKKTQQILSSVFYTATCTLAFRILNIFSNALFLEKKLQELSSFEADFQNKFKIIVSSYKNKNSGKTVEEVSLIRSYTMNKLFEVCVIELDANKRSILEAEEVNPVLLLDELLNTLVIVIQRTMTFEQFSSKLKIESGSDKNIQEYKAICQSLIHAYSNLEGYYLEGGLLTTLESNTIEPEDLFFLTQKIAERALASGNLDCISLAITLAAQFLRDNYFLLEKSGKLSPILSLKCANELINFIKPDLKASVRSDKDELLVSSNEKALTELQSFFIRKRDKFFASIVGSISSAVVQLVKEIFGGEDLSFDLSESDFAVLDAKSGVAGDELVTPLILEISRSIDREVQRLLVQVEDDGEENIKKGIINALVLPVSSALEESLIQTMLTKTVSQYGAVIFEKEVSSLAKYFDHVKSEGKEEKSLGRLKMFSDVLNVEDPVEARQMLQDDPDKRLTRQEIVKILSTRKEFSNSKISF